MDRNELLTMLNVDTAEERLENLRRIIYEEEKSPQKLPQYANNHIHTIYSFSPYSPTAAVYFARLAGLTTAGIMDHDTIAGAGEFRSAGEIAGIGVTCGMECRVRIDEDWLKGRRLNNPDQARIAYMAVHSVPQQNVEALQDAFAPLRERRNARNARMTDKLNELMLPYGITLSFTEDVLPLTQYAGGGTVTERHLLWALSGKLMDVPGTDKIPEILEKLGISLKNIQKLRLVPDNEYLRYDLLGILKAGLVKKFYIPAADECMSLGELVELSGRADAILCYAYLGDVGESVTGDKLAERYEDSFLDELFPFLKNAGVSGITYMPSRNTDSQIARVRSLCKDYGMLEISGEDINTLRQSFICEKLAEPGFSHLVDATWHMIKREQGGKQQ